MRAVEEIALHDSGMRIWLTHGHQFDPLISEGPAPFMVSWIVGQVRRMGQKGLADLLEGRFFMACQRLVCSLGSPRSTARNALMQNECDVVIMGYTHQAECVRFGNGVYANSGACLPDLLSYLSIDTLTREVQLCQFQESNRSRKVLSLMAAPQLIRE
jgi:hypothetical protein